MKYPLSFHKLIPVLGFMVTFIASCEKDPEPLTTNSTIRGVVQSAFYFQTEPEIITIKAIGPWGSKAVTIDGTGEYAISGLGNGTYIVECSCEGFGTLSRYGIQLFGSDTVTIEDFALFEKAGSFNPPVLSSSYFLEESGYDYLYIKTNYRQQLFYSALPLQIFMDTDENVSCDDYSYMVSSSNIDWDNDGTVLFWTWGLPFDSGEMVYAVGYVCNPWEYNHATINTYTGKLLLSTLEPDKFTNKISFVMP